MVLYAKELNSILNAFHHKLTIILYTQLINLIVFYMTKQWGITYENY